MPTVIRLPVEQSSMEVYVESRAPMPRGPATILMFPRSGLDGFVRTTALILAKKGYRTVVPDVTHRCPPDMPIRDRKQHLRDEEMVTDIRATATYLRSRPDVLGDRITIMGHCMGGRNAFLGACVEPGIKGAVIYYGGDIFEAWGDGPAPIDRVGDLRCPVIGFFGEKDTNPSPQDVVRFGERLTASRINHSFYNYPDIGHAFQQRADESPANRSASRDSWKKTIDFLDSVSGFARQSDEWPNVGHPR